MALPSDPAETFVREVDENLRRDQMRDMAKTYGKWIIAAIVLFLAAVGGYLYWQHRQESQAIANSEAMSTALDKIASGDVKAADAALVPLSEFLGRCDPGQCVIRSGRACASQKRQESGDRTL